MLDLTRVAENIIRDDAELGRYRRTAACISECTPQTRAPGSPGHVSDRPRARSLSKRLPALPPSSPQPAPHRAVEPTRARPPGRTRGDKLRRLWFHTSCQRPLGHLAPRAEQTGDASVSITENPGATAAETVTARTASGGSCVGRGHSPPNGLGLPCPLCPALPPPVGTEGREGAQRAHTSHPGRKLQRAVRDVRQHHSAPSPSPRPWEITESGQLHEAGASCTADRAQRDKAKPGPLDGTLPARLDGNVRGQLTCAGPELGSCQPDFRPGAPGRAEHRLPGRRPHSVRPAHPRAVS